MQSIRFKDSEPGIKERLPIGPECAIDIYLQFSFVSDVEVEVLAPFGYLDLSHVVAPRVLLHIPLPLILVFDAQLTDDEVDIFDEKT